MQTVKQSRMTKIDFSLEFTAEQVERNTEAVINDCDKSSERILGLKPSEWTFDSVIVPFHKSEEVAAE